MAHAMIHHDTVSHIDGSACHHIPAHNTGPLPPQPHHNPIPNHPGSHHGHLHHDATGHIFYDFGHNGVNDGSHIGTFVW